MYSFNRFDSGYAGDFFHNKSVSGPLRVDPGVGIKANVAVDAIQEFPGVRDITRVHIMSLHVARLAEYRP
jgi:hypothetical protein